MKRSEDCLRVHEGHDDEEGGGEQRRTGRIQDRNGYGKKGKRILSEVPRAAKTDKEKALFKRLIEEERQHYEIFENTYSHLSDTGNWFLWEERGVIEG